MRRQVLERTIAVADFVDKTGVTVREAALVFGVGKSTIHKDLRERLKVAKERKRYRAVDAVLQKNLRERHIRGGEATRRKYAEMKDGTS